MEIGSIHKIFLKSNGVSTDSRKVKKNDIYFSLKGPNFNGKEFAKSAIEKGACYAIVDEKEYVIDKSYILVEDCLKTLQNLANYHRKNSKAKIIGLTGSNGKTTSKELIFSVLKNEFKTIATTGNLNNHIGVPLTLLSIKEDTEIAIIEMGANHLKEIETLSNIADPDYGYITNFGKAHLEGFKNLEGVIKGKSELYNHLINKSRLIFINNRDKKQVELTKEYSNKFTFGEQNSDSIFSVKSINPTINISIDNILIESNLFGQYNIDNIAAAICIGKYFNLDNENIKSGIERYIPENNRSQIIKKGSNKIILDAYNANPTSMQLALSSFNDMKEGKKIVFIGDMFELGENSHQMHQEIVYTVEKMNFDQTFIIGELFNKTTHSSNIRSFKNLNDLKGNMDEISNSAILIKGSRGMKLENILDFI